MMTTKVEGKVAFLKKTVNAAAGKVEFLEDATREELEELNKPRLWKFLNQFKKK